MPSQARILARDKMIPEVQRLIESHKELRQGRRGRDPYNAILKSSVVMLSATWELYCEAVLCEAASKIIEHHQGPDTLPEAIKAELKNAVHHTEAVKSEPLKLAGDGWRTVYRDHVSDACARFNTPKTENLDRLFKRYIGLRNLSGKWHHTGVEIDKFVTTRGESAHRGTDAENVSRTDATHFKAMIFRTISDTDDALYEYLKKKQITGRAPWQKTS